MAKSARRPKARFVVDLTELNLSADQQKEVATAIQAVVLQLLATRMKTPRPYIDLARAPGPSGWAGAFVAEDDGAFKKLQKKYQWGRPGGKAVTFFD